MRSSVQRPLTAWYAATVGALAVLPYLAPRLTDAGMTDRTAALTLTAIPLGTLLGGPLSAWIVDRTRRARPILVGALLATSATLMALAVVRPAMFLVALIAVFGLVRAPTFPIADAFTVRTLGSRYGTVRAVGSIAYIAVVLAGGLFRDGSSTAPLWLASALLLVAAGIATRLPEMPPTERPHRRDMLALLRRPAIAVLLLVAMLNGLSLTTYDHLFALHADRIGMDGWFAGAAISGGVLVEVGLMFAAPTLIERVGAPRLLLFSCAAGVPRFAATAWFDSASGLAAAQLLHGVQFGLFWVAAVHQIAVLSPDKLARSAQSLLPATAFGIAPLVGLSASAWWLEGGSTRTLFGLLVIPSALATLLATGLTLGGSQSASPR